MNVVANISGGCACGAVRYVYRGDAQRAFCCHCEQCQKTSGGPFIAGFVADTDRLELVAGTPAVYASTEWGERHFCVQCGAPLFFRYSADSRQTVVMASSMDATNDIAPKVHIWTSESPAWLALADELPRHLQGMPK